MKQILKAPIMIAGVAPSPTSPHVPLAGIVLSWLRAHRQRRALIRELAKLSSEQLRDIGVDSADITDKVDAGLAKIDLRRLGSVGLR